MVKSSDLSSNTAVQFCRAVFDSDRSFDLLQELQEQQQGLTKVAEICEMTANASADVRLQKYLQEAQVSLNEIAYNVEHVFEWVSDQERREILQWVSNVQYGRHYDDIERRRSPDTGDWLLRHGNFIEWLDSPGSSVIWLQGSRKFVIFCTHYCDTDIISRHGKDIFECSSDQSFNQVQGSLS